MELSWTGYAINYFGYGNLICSYLQGLCPEVTFKLMNLGLVVVHILEVMPADIVIILELVAVD